MVEVEEQEVVVGRSHRGGYGRRQHYNYTHTYKRETTSWAHSLLILTNLDMRISGTLCVSGVNIAVANAVNMFRCAEHETLLY